MKNRSTLQKTLQNLSVAFLVFSFLGVEPSHSLAPLVAHLAHADDSSLNFSKALSLYGAGKLDQAFPLFEEVFSDQNSTPGRRQQSSLILAYAPNSGLKKKKRHFYASYYLENQKDAETPEGKKTRAALLRIAGDGFFDEMKLESAQQRYLLLAADSDVKNQAYAQYRMGWIEINQQTPQATLNRWAHFLAQNEKTLVEQDPELFRSILRDTGRAWVEASESAPTTVALPAFMQSLAQAHEADFVDGVVLGLKRSSQSEVIERFRVALASTSFTPSILSQLLKKGIVFNHFPCDLSRWMASPQKLSAADQEAALPIMNACAKQITEKNLCETPTGLAARQLFAGFSLQGDALLPRISLSIECKEWKSSCHDLLQHAFFQIEGNTTQKTAKQETESALFETCAHSIKPTFEPEIQAGILKLVTLSVRKGIYPTESTRPLHQLIELSLAQPGFFNSTLNLLLTPSDLTPALKKTLLPERFAHFIPQLAPAQRPETSQKLMAIYADVPAQGIWLQLLKLSLEHAMESKDYAAAQLLLDTYLPLNATFKMSEETSGPWEFFWLSVDPSFYPAQEARVQFWLTQLPWKTLNTERRQRAFSILLKQERLPLIWTHWAQFSGIFPSFPKPLQTLFYAQTQTALQSGTLDTAQVSSAGIAGKTLSRMAKNDVTLTPAEIQKALGGAAPAFALAQDLDSLSQLKNSSKKLHRESLKLNASLTRVLGAKLTTLQKSESIFSSTPWVSTEMQQSAKTLFTQDCKDLIQELEKIEGALAKEPELAEILEQMSQIKAQVQEKLPAENPAPAPTPSQLSEKESK